MICERRLSNFTTWCGRAGKFMAGDADCYSSSSTSSSNITASSVSGMNARGNASSHPTCRAV